MTAVAQVMMIPLFDEFGPVLTSRATAEELRHRIEAAVDHGSTVVLDFAGVEVMSPSFADEIFAKVPREFVDDRRIVFDNLNEDLTHLARFVVSGRAQLS